MIILLSLVSQYLLGVVVFAVITRKTFGNLMGFSRWTPLIFGIVWPYIAVYMLAELFDGWRKS